MHCFSNGSQESLPFDKVCRTCLSVLSPVRSIFETTLASGDLVYQVLDNFFGLKISVSDKIRPNICVSCLWKIEDFLAFKKHALYADLHIQRIVGDAECTRTNRNTLVEDGIERQFQPELLPEVPIIKQEQSSPIPFNDMSEVLITEIAVDDETLAPQPWEEKDNISHSTISSLPHQECRSSEAENEVTPIIEIEDTGLGCSPEWNHGNEGNEGGSKDRSEEKAFFQCHRSGAIINREKGMKEHIYGEHFQPYNYIEVKEEIQEATLENFIDSVVNLSHNTQKQSQNKRKRGRPVKHRNACSSKEISNHFTHTDGKPFKCPYCDYTCKNKHYLKKHNLIHSGERPYKCPHCDYRCSRKEHLKLHLRTHTGERPYKCPHCDYGCSQKQSLKGHIRKHTGEKPFKCSHCDYRCSQKNSLILHLRIHTGEKPFKCPHCDYRCSARSNLKSHLWTHR